MFRFKKEVINNCKYLYEYGLSLHEVKFRNLLYTYCSTQQIAIDPITRLPKEEFPHNASMTKEEWIKFELILVDIISYIKLLYY